MRHELKKGFTLIELIVAVGLFAAVMTIAAGAYLTIIRAQQQAQAVASGIDNLSFALDTMTRAIRSGSNYCGGSQSSCQATSFTFKDVTNQTITYQLASGAIQEVVNGRSPMNLTDPAVTITALRFSVSGVARLPTDATQPYVTIVVAGTVPAGPGKTQSFAVESSAVWRGSDI